MSEPIHIPNFRVVFQIERRIFRVGDQRIPVPYGIPLAGAAYFITALAIVFLVGQLPVVSWPMGQVPFPIKWITFPGLCAWFLVRVRPDGRSGARLLRALLRYAVGPREVAGWRRVSRQRVVRLKDLEIAPGQTGTRALSHRLLPARDAFLERTAP
jgi:TcpE family